MATAPDWSRVGSSLAIHLGQPVRLSEPLGTSRLTRATRAFEATRLGDLVVKVRLGDRADEKTRWCATHLPLLIGRGYPAPEVVWHGFVDDQWYAIVQRRLAGTPLKSIQPPLLDELVTLVELQADAGIDPGVRDFAGYVAHVLFDGWDNVWRDAALASAEAAELCERVHRWLQPFWGHQLAGRDFAHNDLNPSNILSDGKAITGIVDWDEFALNTRATDLVGLAFGCVQPDAVPDDGPTVVFERALRIAGDGALRCLVAYEIVGTLAAHFRRDELEAADHAVALDNHVLEILGAT